MILRIIDSNRIRCGPPGPTTFLLLGSWGDRAGAKSLSSRLYRRSRFFFFHRRCRHFVDCGSFLITPWLMMWKKRRKKNEKMCLHTQQVFSFSARSGLGTITRPEPFVGHVLTFLNPLSVVLGQWMETIDREICAVLELKRVSDRRRLVDGENGVHPPAVRKRWKRERRMKTSGPIEHSIQHEIPRS